jgi:hypothetical protein
MSRKIETAILQALADHPGRRFSVSELAGIVYGLQPNPAGVVIAPEAQAAAVRNTLANLERRGRASYVARFYESPSARRVGHPPVSMWASAEAAKAHAEAALRAHGAEHVSEDLRRRMLPRTQGCELGLTAVYDLVWG